ncbi:MULTISPECIES: hypothetical protein [Bacillaceae]|uniref:Uncharacterized protein n=1 Tax=Domibacillus aminovorans TaxID=29332 RepID=A0A177KVD8_9BACI|nr:MULTISPECIES: hypothetical protein [Bacillaceae]OAH57087.1 hypothetical protein AWH48_19355 [Domibacillus aminovorans]
MTFDEYNEVCERLDRLVIVAEYLQDLLGATEDEQLRESIVNVLECAGNEFHELLGKLDAAEFEAEQGDPTDEDIDCDTCEE